LGAGRARYAAEFAEASAEAEQFIAEVKRLQDVLGDWHDWLTLTQTAGEHLGELRESALVAELHNVTGAKFRHAVAVLSQMRSRGVAKPTAAAKVSTAKGRPSTSAA
jgi:CHAD domain-containing protein